MKIAISDIDVGERHRKDLGDLQELAKSIQEQGLLQPIGITEDHKLVFGERRLRACELLGWDTIDVRIVNVTSIVEGELTENEVRKQFTIEERVAIGKAVEEVIGNRVGRPKKSEELESGEEQENNKEIPHLGAEIKGSETRDIAAKKAGFGSHKSYGMAKYIVDKAPEEKLEAINSGKKSISAVYKEIKHDERLKKQEEEIKRNRKNALPANIQLLEGDFFDVIDKVEDGSVDLLLVDPPYGVMSDFEWDKKDLDFLDNWLSKVKPKLKDKHMGFIFCDARMQYEFETIIRKYFKIKNRIIWVRKNMSMGRHTKYRFVSSHEVIFFFGNKELNFPDKWGDESFDVMEFAAPQSNFKEGKYHPTQKPLKLFERLVKLGSTEGELVFDPFAGSGTTGIACKELKRDCIMIEKEQQYIDTIRARI